MTKALISVTGQDTTGIIARVATKLSELNINILDITQTILQGNFTMIMFVELEDETVTIDALSAALDETARELSMVIHVQREDIFDSMNRI